MKRKICLFIAVVMIAGALFGCNLVERDYDSDYAREVAVIKSDTIVVDVEKPIYDEYGLTGETEPKKYYYTYPDVKILKSQLHNYVLSTAQSKLEAGISLDDAIDQILNEIIEYELTLIEADKRFYAGQLYWTQSDIDEIQRAVYSVIDYELFTIRNSLLAQRGKDEVAEPSGEDSSTPQTTYPTMPEEEEEKDHVRAAYYYKNNGKFTWSYNEPSELTYQWHDEWYTENSIWYITDTSKHLAAYPGIHGDADQISLEKEAMNQYLNNIIEKSDVIIGLTSEQKQIIKGEIEELNNIKNNVGIEYVYPKLGSTLLIKLLVGNTYIKSAKMTKLQNYVTDGVTVSYKEVQDEYDRQLSNQKALFADETNYIRTVNQGNLALYAPTNRYVFVKHILLQFSPEQKEALEAESKRLGADEDAIKAYRANLANEIIAYEHIDGEDDLSTAKPAAAVYNEVRVALERYKNAPKYAEREFDKLIYKYNQDPGIFQDKYIRYGYAVVYNQGEEGETIHEDQDEMSFMEEFHLGAKELRDNGYKPGQLLDHYVVTEAGIHIIYYAADPRANDVKGLNAYTTLGQHETVYQTIESTLLSSKKSGVYEFYIASSLAKGFKKVEQQDKIISEYKKELQK